MKELKSRTVLRAHLLDTAGNRWMETEVLKMVNLKIRISSCPLNMETEGSSEILIATYQTAGCHTLKTVIL
jgi:hypothetical protein